ncbi:MAG TPA: HAD family phosphatase [Patescibacteria group bacterium]|nr:HAD family phosphatase [Patescibacteria group bacterium]
MAVRAFLFDLDGVLVDTTRIIQRGWERFAAERGLSIPEADYPRFIYGRRTREILLEYFKLSEAESDRLIAQGLDDKTKLVAREGGLSEIPGASHFVRASKALGLRIALASSASAPNVALALSALGIVDQFDAVVTSADVKKGKPAPDPYLEAARRLDSTPGDSVVFEDTVFGIASAHAAGARCVGLATTLTRDRLSEADLVIDDFRGAEPAALIRALGA